MKLSLALIIILMMTLLGCEKIPEKGEEQYGPMVSEAQLIQEIAKANNGEGPATIKLWDYQRTEVYRIIAQNPPQYFSEIDTLIINREDVPGENSLRISYMEKAQRYDQNNQLINAPWFEFDGEIKLAKKSNEPFTLANLSVLAKKQLLQPQTTRSTKPFKTTYHNFAVRYFEEPVPQTAYDEHGCQNIPNCQLHVAQLSYDQVSWYAEGTNGGVRGRRIIIEAKISKDLPYLAREFHKCIRQEAPVNDTYVVVTDCEDVTKFQFGGDNPPSQMVLKSLY
jgi:hypothetical protein